MWKYMLLVDELKSFSILLFICCICLSQILCSREIWVDVMSWSFGPHLVFYRVLEQIVMECNPIFVILSNITLFSSLVGFGGCFQGLWFRFLFVWWLSGTDIWQRLCSSTGWLVKPGINILWESSLLRLRFQNTKTNSLRSSREIFPRI